MLSREKGNCADVITYTRESLKRGSLVPMPGSSKISVFDDRLLRTPFFW